MIFPLVLLTFLENLTILLLVKTSTLDTEKGATLPLKFLKSAAHDKKDKQI